MRLGPPRCAGIRCGCAAILRPLPVRRYKLALVIVYVTDYKRCCEETATACPERGHTRREPRRAWIRRPAHRSSHHPIHQPARRSARCGGGTITTGKVRSATLREDINYTAYLP